MTDVLITGARVLDPAAGLDAKRCVAVSRGKITHVTAQPPKRAGKRLDADGLWLVPGLVDLCARLREPGATHKATVRSEIPAAQAGGITTLCIPPDTRPVIDTPSVVDRIQARVAQFGGLDVRVLGALTQGLDGEALPDMAALASGGAVGVTNALAPLLNLRIAHRALQYAQGCGLTVHVVPLEESLAAGGCAHQGAVGTRLGLSGIPEAAETIVVSQWLTLVEDTRARVHFGRLSTARAADMVADAIKRKLPVSADVAAHQLFLNEDAVDGYDPIGRVLPPLRAERDRRALLKAVKRGTISAVCSDHQPHETDAKVNPFPLVEPGLSGLETLLPLMLKLADTGELAPLDAIARVTSGPADVLGLPIGRLAVGGPANFVLVDPKARWTLKAGELKSAGRNTAFDGWAFRGRVHSTWFAGRRVHGG